jgi:hypothetical protein
MLILAFVIPVLFLQAQKSPEKTTPKYHQKEVPASRLPKKATKFISANLPHATITRVIRQRGNPDEKFIVSVTIKTFHHVLIFNRHGDFVRLVRGKQRNPKK